jgi:hypothetical protein
VLPRQLAASIQPAAARTTPGDGQQIFRFDTFGDEQLWTDVLQMNQVVETSVDQLQLWQSA